MDQQIITAYGICSHHNYEALAGLVNDGIKKGWQPIHPVFTSAYDNKQFFHQAMVKYSPAFTILNGGHEIVTTKESIDAVLKKIALRNRKNKKSTSTEKTAATKKKAARKHSPALR